MNELCLDLLSGSQVSIILLGLHVESWVCNRPSSDFPLRMEFSSQIEIISRIFFDNGWLDQAPGLTPRNSYSVLRNYNYGPR